MRLYSSSVRYSHRVYVEQEINSGSETHRIRFNWGGKETAYASSSHCVRKKYNCFIWYGGKLRYTQMWASLKQCQMCILSQLNESERKSEMLEIVRIQTTKLRTYFTYTHLMTSMIASHRHWKSINFFAKALSENFIVVLFYLLHISIVCVCVYMQTQDSKLIWTLSDILYRISISMCALIFNEKPLTAFKQNTRQKYRRILHSLSLSISVFSTIFSPTFACSETLNLAGSYYHVLMLARVCVCMLFWK